jgi:hypothetical protein
VSSKESRGKASIEDKTEEVERKKSESNLEAQNAE